MGNYNIIYSKVYSIPATSGYSSITIPFYYDFQKQIAMILFLYFGYRWYAVNQAYFHDMNYKNIYITEAVVKLDEAIVLSTNSDNNSLPVLPLTKLERKRFIYLQENVYLQTEVQRLLTSLLKYASIVTLYVTIQIMDWQFCRRVHDQTDDDCEFSVDASVRLYLTSFYMAFSGINIFLEPAVNRLHINLLESYFPSISTRRALVLIETIRLQRLGFIEANRIIIHFRFNSTGSLWNFFKGCVEE